MVRRISSDTALLNLYHFNMTSYLSLSGPCRNYKQKRKIGLEYKRDLPPRYLQKLDTMMDTLYLLE